jgi:hypothetical protein
MENLDKNGLILKRNLQRKMKWKIDQMFIPMMFQNVLSWEMVKYVIKLNLLNLKMKSFRLITLLGIFSHIRSRL